MSNCSQTGHQYVDRTARQGNRIVVLVYCASCGKGLVSREIGLDPVAA